jgi:hypothetical protein
MGGDHTLLEHCRWPLASRNTMRATLIAMVRIADTPRFAMTAMWTIFTIVTFTICTRIMWTNMSSQSMPQIR